MKLIDGLNFVNSINEKVYNNHEMMQNPFQAKYYETIHSSLVEFFKSFTEKEYNEISLMLRKSIERLEKDLLLRCGNDYQEEYKKYLAENSKFKVKNDATKTKTTKKSIGFAIEREEGIST